jgi:NADH-quinone oxidoreductase subunit A
MTALTGYLLVFLVVAVVFVFFHLMLGKIVRPARPDAEKLTIYECGEPTIGSSWIQFDLRFYVVALLFVIFDVEVVFFFPWAVVFGKSTALAKNMDPASRTQVSEELVAPELRQHVGKLAAGDEAIQPAGASKLAWLAFWDIMVFFSVLLVGFAYLWKRGDLDWVRSTMAEQEPALPPLERAPRPLPESAEEKVLVGAGNGAAH